MLTYFLDVKAADHTLNRFEVRFALDDEAIRHSKELAAQTDTFPTSRAS